MSHPPESQEIPGGRKGKPKKPRKSSLGLDTPPTSPNSVVGPQQQQSSSFSGTTGGDSESSPNSNVFPYRRKKPTFTREVTEFLRSWIISHADYPYPTEQEKRELSDITGLSGGQITNWMVNARRRIPDIQQSRVAGAYAEQEGNAPLQMPPNLNNTPRQPSIYPAPIPSYTRNAYQKILPQITDASPSTSHPIPHKYSSPSNIRPPDERSRGISIGETYPPTTQETSKQPQPYPAKYSRDYTSAWIAAQRAGLPSQSPLEPKSEPLPQTPSSGWQQPYPSDSEYHPDSLLNRPFPLRPIDRYPDLMIQEKKERYSHSETRGFQQPYPPETRSFSGSQQAYPTGDDSLAASSWYGAHRVDTRLESASEARGFSQRQPYPSDNVLASDASSWYYGTQRVGPRLEAESETRSFSQQPHSESKYHSG